MPFLLQPLAVVLLALGMPPAVAVTLHPLDGHVAAARAAGATGAARIRLTPPEATHLLLAMGYIESRYNPSALSRLERQPDGGYRRRTGVWPAVTPPSTAKPPWFCGPVQTGGRVPWATCQRMRTDLTFAYATALDELAGWYRDPACRRRGAGRARLTCTLHGYGGGYRMIAAGTHRYPARVLARAGWISACAARGMPLAACLTQPRRRRDVAPRSF